MIDPLTEQGIACHQHALGLVQLRGRQKATIKRQAALLKQTCGRAWPGAWRQATSSLSLDGVLC